MLKCIKVGIGWPSTEAGINVACSKLLASVLSHFPTDFSRKKITGLPFVINQEFNFSTLRNFHFLFCCLLSMFGQIFQAWLGNCNNIPQRFLSFYLGRLINIGQNPLFRVIKSNLALLNFLLPL